MTTDLPRDAQKLRSSDGFSPEQKKLLIVRVNVAGHIL